MMDQKFADLIESLHPAVQQLLSMAPVRQRQFPKPMPKKRGYLFSENDNHLYVGRTKSIQQKKGSGKWIFDLSRRD